MDAARELEARVAERTASLAERSAELRVAVDPVLAVSARFAALPLAAGGVNQASFQLLNLADHPVDVSFAAEPPPGGAEVEVPAALTIPAASSVEITVPLRGLYLMSGSAPLTLVARTSRGAVATARVELLFSDDLVQNISGTPWPRMIATSQAAFPPGLAADGNSATFWVSSGTASGQGPTPTNPVMLTADLGAPAKIGSVVMVPRTSFGPSAYTIEISDDDVIWEEIASVPSAPNGTVTTRFSPATARYLRLRMTGGYDRIQPPRNVQVASLIVRGVPFEGDLAQSVAGAPFPAVSATSWQAAFPPDRSVDGDAQSFWVSAGTAPGEGPSPEAPQALAVDLGAPMRVGTVVMVPRVNFGPAAYRIEASDDGITWTELADVASAPNGTVPTWLSPVVARHFRLVITAGHDAVRPPRNVQIASFVLLPALEIR